MTSSFFWDLTPGSPLKVNQVKVLILSPPAFTLDSCSAYSSTMELEATCSSETSVGFQRSTRRYPKTTVVRTSEPICGYYARVRVNSISFISINIIILYRFNMLLTYPLCSLNFSYCITFIWERWSDRRTKKIIKKLHNFYFWSNNKIITL
jgi:hypothetical protein